MLQGRVIPALAAELQMMDTVNNWQNATKDGHFDFAKHLHLRVRWPPISPLCQAD